MLFVLFINLYTSRIVLGTLGITDYGLYNVIAGFVSLFQIFSAGMSSATQRYFSYEIGKCDLTVLKETFSSCFFLYIIVAFIILICLEGIGVWMLNSKMVIPPDRLTAANWVFQISAISLVVNLLSTPYNSLIIAYEEMKTFAFISIIEVILKLFLAISLSFVSLDLLVFYSLVLCLIQIIIRIVYTIYCRRKFSVSKISFSFNLLKIKELYSYTGWAMFGGISFMIRTQGLNVLLNMFFGPVVNAARGIAVQVQAAVNGFVTNFQMALNPQIFKLYAAGDFEEVQKMVFRSAKISFLLLLLLSLPVLIETKLVLQLWLGEIPEYTVPFIRLMMIISFIDAFSNPFVRSIEATGNIRNYQIIVGGMMILILPVAYIFLKLGFSPISVYIITIVISLISFFYRIRLCKDVLGFSIKSLFFDVIVKLIFVFICGGIIPIIFFCLMKEGFVRFFLILFSSILFTCISSYSIAFSCEDRMILKKIFCRKDA